MTDEPLPEIPPAPESVPESSKAPAEDRNLDTHSEPAAEVTASPGQNQGLDGQSESPTALIQNQTLDAHSEPAAEVAASPAQDQGLNGQSESPTTLIQDQGQDGQSFADALSAFERSHTHRAATRQLQGTVVSLTADQVILDVGYKMEGVLPRSALPNNAEGVNPGDTFPVSITGRNEEGYYELSRFRVAQPRDWSALERAFAEKIAVAGTVTAVIKGGLSVDIGVRAFMPASRSGTRDAAELEALVGQQITCRITKLDVTDEDVVVDRRVVLEEQARGELAGRRAALKPGDTVTGIVRTLMPYGAFVEIEPGLDGLLHISDISHSRVAKPEDVLSVGEQLTLRILKIDPETNKISLGLKQTPARAVGNRVRALPARPARQWCSYAPHRLRRIRRARAWP